MQLLTSFSILRILSMLPRFHNADSAEYRAVVYPEIFDGRDERTRVLKINDEITLNLEPSSILHENFFLRTYRQGVAVHKYFNVDELQKDMYHDAGRLAVVTISEEGGRLQVEGVLGPKLKIRPMDVMERSVDGRQAHLVENIDDTDSDNVYGIPNPKKVDERAENPKTGFDPNAFSVKMIHPEIFVVCDSVFHKGFNTTAKMIKYVMIVYQVVNLRYRTVKTVKVRLLLRGIEVSELRQEQTYYHYLGGNDIDGFASITNIVKFFKEKEEFYGKYDLVYFLTGMNMVAIQGTTRLDSLSGFAFAASACSDSRQQLGEDTPYTYRGIRITAHEVAHTLGCTHDGTRAPGHSKTFTPDALRCPWDIGNLMSYEEKGSNSMRFSSCCDYDIAQMAWTYEGVCLRTNDTAVIAERWKARYRLPGEFLSRDKQCKLTYPELAGTYYMRDLGNEGCMIHCFVHGYQFQAADHQWEAWLIDGSPCTSDRKMICINGECVPDERPATRRTKKAKRTTKSVPNEDGSEDANISTKEDITTEI
ncbi:venom metalloproteinase antarease-like TtrivMP_A [Rhipicephalus sanguineus]|uniref:venom metalloproteinase antarease-like TtrivMP_A n=1 Tax=Rhipicephalus sanguineus TaxID=34632 RepID=UPI001894B37B|nr:venom metalloproteinase antarease-like TtrivMP_A [Rhipicephalus sanguineus]